MSMDRRDDLDYETFFSEYMWKNKPVLIGEKMTRDWRSRKEWVKEGKPNFELLVSLFGQSRVHVTDCRSLPEQKKFILGFEDFIEYWKELNNGSKNQKDEKCLYLKDWHICSEYPDYQAYSLSQLFSDDWLNSYWDQKEGTRDDFRFCYMGVKGSWTPLHADVYRSYSWSTNIVGKKLWTFFPPDQYEMLKDRYGNLVYNIRNVDINQFPNFRKAKSFTVIQNEGETIFVPSSWFHQVENLEDTISINHNWGNGCNIIYMWNSIRDDLSDVKRVLPTFADKEEWEDHCQVVLKANSGITLQEFFCYLEHGFQTMSNSTKGIISKQNEILVYSRLLKILEEFENEPITTRMEKNGEIQLQALKKEIQTKLQVLQL